MRHLTRAPRRVLFHSSQRTQARKKKEPHEQSIALVGFDDWRTTRRSPPSRPKDVALVDPIVSVLCERR